MNHPRSCSPADRSRRRSTTRAAGQLLDSVEDFWIVARSSRSGSPIENTARLVVAQHARDHDHRCRCTAGNRLACVRRRWNATSAISRPRASAEIVPRRIPAHRDRLDAKAGPEVNRETRRWSDSGSPRSQMIVTSRVLQRLRNAQRDRHCAAGRDPAKIPSSRASLRAISSSFGLLTAPADRRAPVLDPREIPPAATCGCPGSASPLRLAADD